MSADKHKKLQNTLADIQQRWGARAVRLLGKQAVSVSTISTGFETLDRTVGVGGIPRGRMSEIIGAPTSGMATLALKVIAAAQAGHGVAVYLDAEQTFDPAYAYRCGVDLEQLFLVRFEHSRQVIAALPDFIANGGVDALVVDLPWRLAEDEGLMGRLATTLGRIVAPLSRTGCALLFLTTLPAAAPEMPDGYPQSGTLPHYATLRLLIQKERWLYRRRDVAGYEAQVLVVKNKLDRPGRRARITITFDETVQGDNS